MSVVSCLEEELQYIIAISCYYKDEIEDEGLKFDKNSFYIKFKCLLTELHYLGPLNFTPGLNWFVFRQPRCESNHHITLALDQFFGMGTLSFSVPYPSSPKRWLLCRLDLDSFV
jgi:hypothetical protein